MQTICELKMKLNIFYFTLPQSGCTTANYTKIHMQKWLFFHFVYFIFILSPSLGAQLWATLRSACSVVQFMWPVTPYRLSVDIQFYLITGIDIEYLIMIIYPIFTFAVI